MKLSKNMQVTILVILLIISSILLLVTKSERNALQKKIDLIYTNAISDSMGGLAKDYTQLDTDEKAQLYYQTISNLRDATEVFYITSYKEHNYLSQTLNKLYTYLLFNKNENYEFEDTLYIFTFLGKILVYPEDEQIISDFNDFIDSKKNN